LPESGEPAIARAMSEPAFLLFASDATLLGIGGAALILVSFAAALGEKRRRRRREVDAVGCMPWTTLSVLTFMAGAALIAAAGGWLGI
jgi:hypothetical protein